MSGQSLDDLFVLSPERNDRIEDVFVRCKKAKSREDYLTVGDESAVPFMDCVKSFEVDSIVDAREGKNEIVYTTCLKSPGYWDVPPWKMN